MDDFVYVRTLRGAIYGKVALVQHRRSGALYALKMMSIAHMSARRAIAGARVREDGDAELRILRQLSGNRVFNTTAVVAASSTDGSYNLPVLETTTCSVRPQWEASHSHSSSRQPSCSSSDALMDPHDHNNLLLLHHDFVDTHTHARCLVFDYCPFGELYDLVQRAPDRALSHETARGVFQQLARAVRFLHARNVAHRDISLENVLLDAQHACRLADFGLASDCGAACTGKVGKVFYMAPEVLLASAPDECYDGLKADIWSLGVLLFIMVTGAPPFECAAESDARFRVVKTQGVGELLGIWRMEHRVSDDLRDLLARMLCVDVRARISIDKVWSHPWVHDSVDVEALMLEDQFAANMVAMASLPPYQQPLDAESAVSGSSIECPGDCAPELLAHHDEPEPHDEVAAASSHADVAKSRYTRKRMKISIGTDSAESLLLPLSESGLDDELFDAFVASPSWDASSSPGTSGIDFGYGFDSGDGHALGAGLAPALAHEQSLWASGATRQEMSALFAPHSTPTAGPRARVVDGRRLMLRSLCFTPSSTHQVSGVQNTSSKHHIGDSVSSSNEGDAGADELKHYASDRRRRTSLSLSCAVMNHAIQAERVRPLQLSQDGCNLRCRFCHDELESSESSESESKASDPSVRASTTLCMCDSCFCALPLTAPLAAHASSVLVLRKVGASTQPSLPAQVA